MATYFLILYVLVSGAGQDPVNIISTVTITKSIESCREGGAKFIKNAIYAEFPDLVTIAAGYQCIKNDRDVVI